MILRTALLSIAFGAAAIALAAPALAADASAARTCTTPKYPGSGYFTSLSVSHVSCSTGRSLTLAHYRCRTKTGPKGRCSSRVRGYSCTEKRNSISTEIDGRVTCKRGTRRVVYTYQQNI
jgi:hypothetical protein